MENPWLENAEQLWSALNHLKSALGLLDASKAPAQIGAHIDLAINHLEKSLPRTVDGRNFQIDTNADPQ